MKNALSTRQNAIIIGKNLRKIREERGITQQDIAKLFNCSSLIVDSWEDGDASLPDISYLNRLAEFYGVDVDYFIEAVKSNGE